MPAASNNVDDETKTTMTHEELSLALNGIPLNLVKNFANNKVEVKKFE